jgi:hypothetical protein
LASIPDADPAPRGSRHPRDAWLRIGAQVFLTFPLPGQPGHGRPACDAQKGPSRALWADARL